MSLHFFFPTTTEPPILEDFLTETAVLVKDRMQVIDREIEEAKRKNIREISKKLQERFGEAGSKMMKRIMEKLSPSQDLWGVNTDYPDCVRVRSTEQ